MVSEHLPMVFPPLFDIDDQQLLEPEAKLYEVVPLDLPINRESWISGPYLVQVAPVGRGVPDVLGEKSSAMRNGLGVRK